MYPNHKQLNQDNYNKHADDHEKLAKDHVQYLAYRDIGALMSRHLYGNKNPSQPIRMLDFGCGAGLSTSIYASQIERDGFKVEITGVDLSAANLALAQKKLPNASMHLVTSKDKLPVQGPFDLIICNLVLLEMETAEMTEYLRQLQSTLADDGILIATNTTGRFYRSEYSWKFFNMHFPENTPTLVVAEKFKLKFTENQPVKAQVFTNKEHTESFTFSDYFHSGSAYRKAYEAAGLTLLETHKPLGKAEDNTEWKDEENTPIYKQHVLKK